LTALTLLWPEELPRAKALLTLLARQERLQSIILKSHALFPSLLISISHGHYRYLTKLSLCVKRGQDGLIDNGAMLPLVELMSAGELPNLQVLHFDGKFKRGATGILRDGLRTGACPKLESLGDFGRLHFKGHANEGMEAVAELIECRQNLPGCSPIRNLGGDWQTFGSDNVRERLLRALRPFIEDFDSDRATANMIRMVKEMGAPYLKVLSVCDSGEVSLLPLIEALNPLTLPSLETLNFCGNALDTACVNQLLGLLRSQHHPLLPPLCSKRKHSSLLQIGSVFSGRWESKKGSSSLLM
jgi:hypothetical protein